MAWQGLASCNFTYDDFYQANFSLLVIMRAKKVTSEELILLSLFCVVQNTETETETEIKLKNTRFFPVSPVLYLF